MRKELEDLDKKMTKMMSEVLCNMGGFRERLDVLEKQVKKLFATKEEKIYDPFGHQAIVESHVNNIISHLSIEHGIEEHVAKRFINHYLDWRVKR
jgi:polyhydroxyalkanoate synthesis regulator phasin